MMKNITIILTILLILNSLDLLSQIDWIKQAGDKNKADLVNSVVSDLSGNIYITGAFSGDAIFEDTIVHSTGGGDCYIAKYNSSGKLVWIRTIGGESNEYGNCVALDKNNNILITGDYTSTIILNNQEFSGKPNAGIFVAKYSNSGELLWFKLYQDKYAAKSNSISTDRDNNIFFVGGYLEICFGSDTLKSDLRAHIFITKLNEKGDLIWSKNLNGHYEGAANGVKCDANNNVIVSANFCDTLIVDNKTIYADKREDIFIGKFTNDGNLIWFKNFDTNYNCKIHDFALDRNDNIYMIGTFWGLLKVDNKLITVKNNISETYVVKYSKKGKLKWFKYFKDNSNIQSITIDKNLNCYISGCFNKDRMIENFKLENKNYDARINSSIAYILKLNKRAKILATMKLDCSGESLIKGLTISEVDNKLIIAGGFSKQFLVDSENFVTTNNTKDIILMKLNNKLYIK